MFFDRKTVHGNYSSSETSKCGKNKIEKRNIINIYCKIVHYINIVFPTVNESEPRKYQSVEAKPRKCQREGATGRDREKA